MELPPGYLKPRLCHLKKRSDFVGYGFNLHSEKGKPGQFIGRVDDNSPADVSGLQANDIVIEVNGENVEESTHQQVVAVVKSNPDHVSMYVCAPETYHYCKDNGIRLASAAPQPQVATTAEKNQEKQQQEQEKQRQQQQQQQRQQQQQQRQQQQQQRQQQQQQRQQQQQQRQQQKQQQQQKQKQQQQRSSENGEDPIAGISLEDMRAKLGSNKRKQAMLNSASFTEKHSLFESL